MSSQYVQLGLFDPPEPSAEAEAQAARVRLRAMIDKVSTATVAPWKTNMECIRMDCDFIQTMRKLPKEEGKALLAEYDLYMNRLYDAWADTQPGGSGPDPFLEYMDK